MAGMGFKKSCLWTYLTPEVRRVDDPDASEVFFEDSTLETWFNRSMSVKIPTMISFVWTSCWDLSAIRKNKFNHI